MGGEATTVPLFPLSHVLLPGMPLPLHIFEQRYRDLLADVTATRAAGAFGVVALRSGTEAHSVHVRTGDPVAAPDVEAIGTVAEILEVETAADGTADLLSVGSRRFRINRLVPADQSGGKAYLRAEIDFLDETEGVIDSGQDARTRELLSLYDAMLARLAGRSTGAELPRDTTALSYHVAARLPLPPAERQALLCDETTAARLERLGRLLRREIALLQGTRSIAVSPAALRMVAGVN